MDQRPDGLRLLFRRLGIAGQELARERVQGPDAIQLDDALQVLLPPILLALASLAQIAVVPLSLTWSSSHVLTPRRSPRSRLFDA